MTKVMCKVSVVTLDHRVLYSTKFTHAENDKYLSTFIADITLDDGKMMDYALISEVLVGPSFQELTCVDRCSLE